MESTGQERRRSARIGNNTLIQQAITEENRLYLKSPYLLKKEAGGTLQVFSTKLVKDQFWLRSGRGFTSGHEADTWYLIGGHTGARSRRKKTLNPSHVQSPFTSIWG